ncbi:hypothetical protein BRAS3809_6300013 [Bradyrhizobium sp. STM 3809]|nr:hypothetical protein BRAS3809_6300013 [Bradyrhizobium sp. STM 3809]
MASPPCSTASASSWPSATRRRSCAPSAASRRAMRPRRRASVSMRAPVIRRRSFQSIVRVLPFSKGKLAVEPATNLFVHDTF